MACFIVLFQSINLGHMGYNVSLSGEAYHCDKWPGCYLLCTLMVSVGMK